MKNGETSPVETTVSKLLIAGTIISDNRYIASARCVCKRNLRISISRVDNQPLLPFGENHTDIYQIESRSLQRAQLSPLLQSKFPAQFCSVIARIINLKQHCITSRTAENAITRYDAPPPSLSFSFAVHSYQLPRRRRSDGRKID